VTHAALVLALLMSGTAAAQGPPGVGAPCVIDAGCPGYLRCLAQACAVPPAITGITTPDTPRVVFDLADGRTATVRVEIVDDRRERARGMMFRDRFADGWGMLFLFPKEEVHRFWMKNTYISLDMVFLGADGTVCGIVRRAKPLDLGGRGVRRPSRDVLELPGGEARRLGVEVGARYRYLHVARPGDGR